MTPDLSHKIEAILFTTSEPQTLRSLGQMTEASEAQIEEAIQLLLGRYATPASALTLVRQGTTVSLGTKPALHEFVSSFTKDEQEKELGQAALETLTIILYQSPISRNMVDKIRGVNSSYILRHLLMRGLIERVQDKKSARSYCYGPTVELLAYLGITSLGELPEHEKIQEEITRYLESHNEVAAAEPTPA